jgi:hypothetical protein
MGENEPFIPTGSALDTRPGGSIPHSLLPAQSRGMELAQRLIRTIVFSTLFLFACKLTHFRQKMLYDIRINRKFLGVFYALSASWAVLYLFLVIRLRALRPKAQRVPVDDWDKVAPIPMYAASGCLVLAVIAFIFALWPCFQVMTLVLGLLGFMTMVFVLQWIPI